MKFDSITFLTRHYPPSKNINGESVLDMVEYFQNNCKIKCNIVHIDMDYNEGVNEKSPIGNTLKVKNYFEKKTGLLKGVKMLLDGYLMVRKAKKIKNTIYVITSSPPLLLFWSSILLKKKSKRVFWALDLFPEMFVANKSISETSFLYKWLLKKSYSVTPDLLISLGPGQADFIQKKYKEEVPSVIVPCGVFDEELSNTQPDWYDEEKVIIGYCGNVGDAHNPNFIRSMIDSIDSERQKLVLALYGNKSAPLKEYAKNKDGIVLVPSVPRNQLSFIDIHMVSLLPEFTHLAVPSKAVSAITMGKSLLFCGSKESDNWRMFSEASWYISDDSNIKQTTDEFCKCISKNNVVQRNTIAIELSLKLKNEMKNKYREIISHFN